jgi:predicted ribosomally synthesized peptide with SipW-like signal peptide
MKILKSAFVVFIVAVIAGGVSYSFFSDSETSTGNTFSAGNLDLKVDSESHYNGMVCENGKWAAESNCKVKGSNLVSNGSFEDPEVTNPDHWQIFNSISPWVVAEAFPGAYKPETGDIKGLEYQENGIYLGSTASDGDQYVELDSYYPVILTQQIAAKPGGKYQISFDYAPRPGHDDNKLQVKFGNSIILDTSLTSTTPFAWHTFSQEITGSTSGNITLSFEETGADDQMGMFLDNVDVRELDCKPLSTPELVGTDCDGSWSLTDLGIQKLFNFSDIKPGDTGEDTVSLHVFDNDAWGRMKIDVTKDSDNTCTEPELEAEPDCTPSGDGELRKDMDFYVWLDEGETPGFQGKGQDVGEGDNIQQENEPILVKSGAIDASGEIHNIWQGLAAAYAYHNCTEPSGHTNYGLCNGLAQDGRMVASTDYYFGLGWDLPMDTGNEVQSDIFQGDISFEVQQYRNNPNPFH